MRSWWRARTVCRKGAPAYGALGSTSCEPCSETMTCEKPAAASGSTTAGSGRRVVEAWGSCEKSGVSVAPPSPSSSLSSLRHPATARRPRRPATRRTRMWFQNGRPVACLESSGSPASHGGFCVRGFRGSSEDTEDERGIRAEPSLRGHRGLRDDSRLSGPSLRTLSPLRTPQLWRGRQPGVALNQLHDPHLPGLRVDLSKTPVVRDVDVSKPVRVGDLMRQWKRGGGFTAKKLADASDMLHRMVADKQEKVILSFPAALMATGTRGVLRDLVK